ncbi:glycosyltransferase family 2 protein [Halalkalicoccus subterraneus]|uniref:glycosyltransferase family 2 protein n=1 Tax=Halalkalicoccus subterraneus TaxID=2675002 RepID=UPI000EFD3607|nr:glycosyltransferase family 2 protein [Halalkalicoccus subterraneus]
MSTKNQQTTQSGYEQSVSEQERGQELLLRADSATTPRLSVVMPTLNEEEGITECIDRIRTAIHELGIPSEIIVSDSSTDRTPEIAREMGAIVVTPDEPGYGYAYRYAFEHARGEYIVIGDADTTYDFEDIPRLLDHLQEEDADMVMGSRLGGEIKPGAMPALHQYVGNPALTKFLNTFYGAGVSDAHSGFRIIRSDSLEALDLKTNGMEFASEMIMEAGASDMKIVEVPITYHEREGEANLESFTDGWRHVRFMLENAPGYLFSVPGIVLTAIGMLVMGLSTFGVPISGVAPGVHSMIAGSLLTIVGYQVISLGVFAAVTSDPIQKPTDPITTWAVENIGLEYGAGAGAVIFGLGAIGALLLIGQWAASGFSTLTFTTLSLASFTAIVIGTQTVFSSFFLSAVNQ